MSDINHIHQNVSEHEELYRLIPWFVNETLSDAESRRVQEHLETCLICRGELNTQRKLAASVLFDDVEKEAVNFNFSRLRTMISDQEKEKERKKEQHQESRIPTEIIPSSSILRPKKRYYYPLTSLAAAVVIAAAGFSLLWEGSAQNDIAPAGEFQTLSSIPAAADSNLGEIFVAFQQGTTETEINQISSEFGLEAVSRSEDGRIWRMRITNRAQGEELFQATVSQLKANQSVLFAEKVISGR